MHKITLGHGSSGALGERFRRNYQSSAVPKGERFWAPGGPKPLLPQLQSPGFPTPPEVHDN